MPYSTAAEDRTHFRTLNFVKKLRNSQDSYFGQRQQMFKFVYSESLLEQRWYMIYTYTKNGDRLNCVQCAEYRGAWTLQTPFNPQKGSTHLNWKCQG